MDDGKLLSTLEYLISAFAGVVARRCTEPVEVVESLRGRMSEGERQFDGLFQSLLVESFEGG